jgi:hypothetical protein
MDNAMERFAEHVKESSKTIAEEVARLHPKFAEEAVSLANALRDSAFKTSEFEIGFIRWMHVCGLIHQASKCDCEQGAARHNFLKSCDQVLTGHAIMIRSEMLIDILKDWDLDSETIDKVVQAMTTHTLSHVMNEDVKVPDYVPAEWDEDGNE